MKLKILVHGKQVSRVLYTTVNTIEKMEGTVASLSYSNDGVIRMELDVVPNRLNVMIDRLEKLPGISLVMLYK